MKRMIPQDQFRRLSRNAPDLGEHLKRTFCILIETQAFFICRDRGMIKTMRMGGAS